MPWNASVLFAGIVLAASAPALAQEPDENWEGLVRVQSDKIEFVYLAPDADFRAYTKVMLEPSEMATEKDWSLQPNGRDSAFRREADERQVVTALERARKRFDRFFADAFTEAGFAVVRSRGADVVRVRVGVFDIDMETPEGNLVTTSERKTLSENAGRATLVVEVRDSVTNALLGRAVDRRIAGDTGIWARSYDSHRVDFNRLFRIWADASAAGIVELKALSPVDVNGGRLAR